MKEDARIHPDDGQSGVVNQWLIYWWPNTEGVGQESEPLRVRSGKQPTREQVRQKIASTMAQSR